MAISLSVIGVVVTPVPVDGLLSSTQLNEVPFFVVLSPIPLVRAVFVGVPVVIVLVTFVIVTLVVLAFSILWFLSSCGLATAIIATGAASATVKRSELRYRYPQCTSVSFGARPTSAESR
jgi:hypothetical protein